MVETGVKTVVVPNWNGLDFLADCLNSLVAQSANNLCARQAWRDGKGGRRRSLEIRDWNPAGASPAQLMPSQQAGSASCMAMG